MLLGILTLLTALSISAVAIYYSVAGLMAIFAAAAVPIMIMGGVLEVSKLVTAVWLHRYWKQATWWLKTYLTTAVFVLMLITSMGIFGFLSKAHIEQTSASEESIARVETIQTEINRQQSILDRAETRIRQLESSETGADANIQSQIDKEQDRIDKAFERIQPAIQQQNKIIEDARVNDSTRTKPYETQLSNIQAELLRLETSAKEYEDKIVNLNADTNSVQPLLDQITNIEAEIIRVTNQLQSREQAQIRAGQAIIGVTSDGLFGNNTREALAKWVAAQQDRISQIQSDISQLRQDANAEVVAERERLAGAVKDIRERQISALKERELTMLGKIDEVRQTESPSIATARDEIQRLRESAEAQVAQSQLLIKRLQEQLANSDNADEVQKSIDEQNERVRTASFEIDQLTDERITLEAEYRKLEAEVGPVKYIAEFIYGEAANNNMLEEAVRWVIITIIFVFDPLAVLLLIASQYTFEFRKRKDDDGERLRLERQEYERARAQRIVDNPRFTLDDSVPPDNNDEDKHEDRKETTREEQQDAEELRTGQDEESVPSEAGHDSNVAETSQEEGSVSEATAKEESTDLKPGTFDGDGPSATEDTGNTQRVPMEQEEDPDQTKERIINDIAKDYIRTDDDLGDNVSEDDTTNSNESDPTVEQSQIQADESQQVIEKKDIKSSADSSQIPDTRNRMFYPEELTPNEHQQERIKSYELKETDQNFLDAKKQWKDDNPDQTLKEFKVKYIRGEIDNLPWESDGYVQNAEQNENSLWNRVKNKKDE